MFSPDGSVTRAMLVTVLHRAEGEGKVTSASGYVDVADDMYYTDAVAWAEANGIVNGYNDTEFGPNDAVLREQIAAILCRYAQYKGYDVSEKANISTYSDYKTISEYAVDSIGWAVEEKIMNGKMNNMIAPQDNATRAEVAAMMQRFTENIK